MKTDFDHDPSFTENRNLTLTVNEKLQIVSIADSIMTRGIGQMVGRAMAGVADKIPSKVAIQYYMQGTITLRIDISCYILDIRSR